MTNPHRKEYQRLYHQLRGTYFTDPDGASADVSWDDYLHKKTAHLKAGARKSGPRGPYKDHSTFTPRQHYQAKYQLARRQAMNNFRDNAAIRGQYGNSFAAYWIACRSEYLPGFFQRKRMQPKAHVACSSAKSAYNTVYTDHRRRWEDNEAEVRERFGTWQKYWAFVKANAFTAPGEQPVADTVAFEAPGSALDGGTYLSKLPEWATKPKAVAVHMDGDPEPEQPWV